MKKALVFRTAQLHVVYNLIEKIERKGYKIWCLVQKSYLDAMKKKYPHISYIIVDDGFFDYKTCKADSALVKKMKKIKFNRVFVPSSTYNFDNFLEVRRIIYSLGFRKITYFSSIGKAVTIDLTLSELLAEKLIKSKHFMAFVISLSNVVLYAFFIKNKIFKSNW